MDRNHFPGPDLVGDSQSLSARRAWIEINGRRGRCRRNCIVALRKESVDRNVDSSLLKASKTGSLSARRAWIEIVD